MLIVVLPSLLCLSSFLITGSDGKTDIECLDDEEIQIKPNDYGNIYSAGYKSGRPYPNPMSCTVALSAEFGKRIRLTFNEIDIAMNPLCQQDMLLLTDTDMNGLDLKNELFCGKIKPPDFLSRAHHIMIRFQASPFGSGKGFNITYREVSEDTLCKHGEFQCRNRKCVHDNKVRCNGKDECGDGTDEEDCGLPVAVPKKCGTPEVKPDTGNILIDRIVGGREAIPGSWPWQVDMQYDMIQPNGHGCGGTLINSQWFITAAHCIVPFRDLDAVVARIHLGNHHKYLTDPFEVVRYMKEYFVYGVNKEEFIVTGVFNITHDLALVKLNAPVVMNPHVQVACLPDPNEELKVGQKCFATGWGATRGSKHDDVLKQAEHPIQPSNRCLTDYIKFDNKTMICAGSLEPLNGLCHGDSGGPLVCQRDGKWHVYGATSYLTDTNRVEGICGIANKPTVFNKISAKIDWIRSTVSNRGSIQLFFPGSYFYLFFIFVNFFLFL